MRTAHKITLGTFTTVGSLLVIVMTIIEKTPNVINAISNMTKAEASEVPDNKNLDTTRTFAGNANIQFENVQKPKGAK